MAREETRTFTVAGLTCIDCAEKVRAAVSRVGGVNDCQVDHASGTLTVSFTTPGLATEQARGALEGLLDMVAQRGREFGQRERVAGGNAS